MMKKILKGYIYIFLIFTTCYPNRQQELADSPSATKIFTEQEVQDLQALLDKFEQTIGIQSNASLEIKAEKYTDFNQRMTEWSQSAMRITPPLTDAQIASLFDLIQINTFRSIWSIGIRKYPNGNIEPDIGIDTQGKFMDYLQELGKDYPQFGVLYNDLLMAEMCRRPLKVRGKQASRL